MKQIRGQEENIGNARNFTEEREKTIEREKTFRHWPHSSPSPIETFTAGLVFDGTKSRDFTRCPYCDFQYDNWQPKENPLTMHRDPSPTCPFVLSSHPMHPSSVPLKRLDEVLTPTRICNEVVQPASNIILTSHSSYAQPTKREQSFSTFPGGSPQNIEALVLSGFYYTGMGYLLRCYNCGEAVNDFHQYPSNEINARHCSRFPRCRFARLMLQERETRSTRNADRCSWCLVEPKELAVDPCIHLAVCGSCAKLINTCPICGEEAEAFFRLYMA